MSKLHVLATSSDIVSFRYPMGEWQVRLSPELTAQGAVADEIYISARVQNADDHIKLMMLIDAFKGPRWKKINLALPYLPYSRADRRFCDGDCYGLDVFLKSVAWGTTLHTLDMHNPSNLLHQYGIHNASPERFITKTIIDISLREKVKHLALVFPDEGAGERYALADTFGSNHHAVSVKKYHGLKERDSNGKITSLVVPRVNEDVVLVVDDICDGGATFSSLANSLCRQTKYLYITHGIFSAGPAPLAAYKRVYTTDSIDRARVPRSIDLDIQFLGKLQEYNSSEVIWGQVKEVSSGVV